MQFYLSIATTIFVQTIDFNESQFVSVYRASINAVYSILYNISDIVYIILFYQRTLSDAYINSSQTVPIL